MAQMLPADTGACGPGAVSGVDVVKELALQLHGALEVAGGFGTGLGVQRGAHTVQLSTQPSHKAAEYVVGVQGDPFRMLKARGQGQVFFGFARARR